MLLFIDDARDDIDAEGHYGRVVNKGQDTMYQSQPPDFPAGDLNIGDLEGHAQYKGKIGEVHKVRL